MEELGIVLPVAIDRAKDVVEGAKLAEAKGFSGVYVPETMGQTPDSLAMALAAGMVTKRVEVGTAITNIYLRHPALTGRAISFINQLTEGRLVLGLGVGHQYSNDALGIPMGPAIPALRNYIQRMTPYVTGDPPPRIYLSALRKGLSRLSGEIADGVMLNMVPLARFAETAAAVWEGERRRKDGKGPARVASIIGISVSDDLEAARQEARRSIAYYVQREFYRRELDEAGYAAVTEQVLRSFASGDRDKAYKAISNELIDELWLVGPGRRCRERLELFRNAGMEEPVLSPRGGVQGFHAAVEAMAPARRGGAERVR